MNIKVTTKKVEIDNESLNKGEYNVRKCDFDLAEEFEGLICKALFTITKTKLTYEQSIVNGKCDIPYEVTINRGKVTLGVIAYEVKDEELIKRYSPEPDDFFVLDGSYVEDIENQSTPTPSELEQLEQRVSAIELDAEQIGINTQNISDLQENKADKSELEDFVTKDVDDLTNYTLTTETGSQIELSLNSTNFKMTATLKDKNGNIVNTSNEIDLPLESVVVNASYDSSTKELVLTLQNGTTVRVSIADLVSGLVSNTDYATANKGGVIKTSSTNSFGLTSSGYPACVPITYDNYTQKDSYAFISKGTLENVIAGKQLVNETELDVLREENAQLKATLPTTTGEGETPTLSKTAEMEFVKPPLPGGNSEQDGEPSPTNEVPITNVTGDVEVLVQNKNLFDEHNVEFITGVLDDNGNPTGSTASHYTNNFYKVNSNTDYIISGTLNSGSSSGRIYFYDKNKNWISRSSGFSGNSKVFTTPVDCCYVRIQVTITINLNSGDVQLEQGTTATPYTPHAEQVKTFPLGTQRMYLGDYLADDGIHHVRGQVVLDGTENWSFDFNCCIRLLKSNVKSASSSSEIANILCNYLTATSQALLQDARVDYGISARSGSYQGFVIRNKDFTSLAEYKSWLAQTLPTVEYELAEEEITPYTTEQQQAYDEIKQAISYEEQTNISGTSDEANPIFSVEAYQSLKLVLAG